MKAISLSRPWPFSILHLGKRIENRSRKDGRMPSICRHRGPLLLHAAKSWDSGAVAWMDGRGLAHRLEVPPKLSAANPAGAIVGRCRAIGHIEPWDCGACGGSTGDDWADCEECEGTFDEAFRLRHDLRWWMGGYALLLADVVAFEEPVPCRGMLGLWTPPADVLSALEAVA